MRFDKLTIKAQEAVAAAQERAGANQHAAVTPMHLLASMVHEADGGVVRPILEKVGAHLPRVQQITGDELYMARIEGVLESLMDAGILREDIRVTQNINGGDGITSDRLVNVILESEADGTETIQTFMAPTNSTGSL